MIRGAAAVITIAGGILQGVGLWIVVVEVRSIRQRVRAHLHRPVTLAGLTASAFGSAMPARITVNPPPPIETRVQILEDLVHGIREQEAAEHLELRRKLTQHADEVATTRANAVRAEVDELGRLVVDLNDEAGLKRTTLGVILAAIGLVLSTGASVWSLWL